MSKIVGHSDVSSGDEEERLPQWVYRRSLTTTEVVVTRLWRINTKQLRLGIEQPELEATEATTMVAKLRSKQDRVVRCLQGYIVISYSSDDNGSDSNGSDIDPPSATDIDNNTND
ncbi:Phosphorylated carbohydrates phosphatase [Hordeum vulgare]|nr:Phosphorylated carbohydrates phosphatase [Hordeum vulgare]